MSLEEIAVLTKTYTGADLAGLVRQASFQALKESMVNESTSDTDIELFVNKGHFLLALKHLRPSVSADVRDYCLYIFSFKKKRNLMIKESFFIGQSSLRKVTDKVHRC